MLGSIVLLYLVLWAVSFGVAWFIGERTGMRYEGLCLTDILGFLGLLIFAAIIAIDGTEPVAARERADR